MTTALTARKRIKWLIFLAGWTVLGLIFAGSLYFGYQMSGLEIKPKHAITIGLIEWYLWALLSLLIIKVGKLFPITKTNWYRAIPLHFGFSLLFVLLHLGLHSLAQTAVVGMWMQFGDTSASRLFYYLLFKKSLTNLLIYWAIIIPPLAIEYYRQRELRESHLKMQLAQAQLQALKMQLQPHFLFNTLHSISALVHEDANAADRMIVRLSEFLRLTLGDLKVQEVSLSHELEVLRKYLEIEQIRFQDRLTVHVDIAPETLDACVPNLLLQPIVENAIRHGIESRSGAGNITIRTQVVSGKLLISVRDNGLGLSSKQSNSIKEGIGLGNTRSRLERLYGSEYTLSYENQQGGGLEVTISLPLYFKEQETSQEFSVAGRPVYQGQQGMVRI